MAEPTGTSEGALPIRPQIKSRDRVRDLAEVFTHEREVHAMLDLVPDMFPSAEHPGNTDRLFLEPACGHGNFLVEILRRKLAWVTVRRYGRGERFEHRVLRCVASTYGIDISDDNVAEARARMRAVIAGHLDDHLGGNGSSAGFDAAVRAILATNVIQADTLANAASIELVEYRSGSVGHFVREWSRPLDPAANGQDPAFHEARRDEAPVHYSELAARTGPVLAARLERKAA